MENIKALIKMRVSDYEVNIIKASRNERGYSMKYCAYCGNEMYDEAVVCVRCGRSVIQAPIQPMPVKQEDDTLMIVVKIFLILGCISQGWAIIPLAWCLPITISIFKRFKERRPIGTGLKICALLFVNLIAGICLLCMNNEI